MLEFYLLAKILRDRLTVGHVPLEDGILVQIQVPQPRQAPTSVTIIFTIIMTTDKKVFSVEIFPKIGSNFAWVGGSIESSFQGIKFLILSSNEPTGLSISKGTSASWSSPNYHQLRLIVEKEITDTNPFVKSEVMCDLISMSTNNYMNYFTPLVDEYSFNGGWSFSDNFPKYPITNSLTNLYSNNDFIDYSLLLKLLKKVEKSAHRDSLLAAFHLNRLAKYKAFSHVTEAVADCVSSLEALYMEEKNGYQSSLIASFFQQEINKLPKGKRFPKSAALITFIKRFYTGNPKNISKVEEYNIYEIRSAYLHRGLLKEPLNGNMSIISLDKLEEQLLYNTFFEVCYNTILNFAMIS